MASRIAVYRVLTALAGLGLACCIFPVGTPAVAVGARRATAAAQTRTPRGHRHSLSPAAATGALGIDLLHTLGDGNLVLSPDSIAAALAMVGTGAAGETEAQIQGALHLSSPAALAAVGTLQHELAVEQAAGGEPQAPTLDIANGLFVQEGFPIETPFVAGLRESFGAAPQRVDFQRDAPAAVRTINAWVSAQTEGLIPELFGALEPETRLVLANAIYLKAAWLTPFSERATAPAPFYAPGRPRPCRS
jgi:serpin B